MRLSLTAYLSMVNAPIRTSAPAEVVLTANEVDRYRRAHPGTMLIVLSGISLVRSQVPPLASGGAPKRIHPWMVEDVDLTPISYRYVVPSR